MANLLGVPVADINSWIAEDKAVPQRYQITIAAYFQMTPREIFTDIKNLEISDQPAQ